MIKRIDFKHSSSLWRIDPYDRRLIIAGITQLMEDATRKDQRKALQRIVTQLDVPARKAGGKVESCES